MPRPSSCFVREELLTAKNAKNREVRKEDLLLSPRSTPYKFADRDFRKGWAAVLQLCPIPSFKVWMVSAETPSNCSVRPLGQRI